MKKVAEKNAAWANRKGHVLATRAINALGTLGITTVDAFREAVASERLVVRDLLKVKNVGRDTIGDIRVWLVEDESPGLSDRCHACGQVLPSSRARSAPSK